MPVAHSCYKQTVILRNEFNILWYPLYSPPTPTPNIPIPDVPQQRVGQFVPDQRKESTVLHVCIE